MDPPNSESLSKSHPCCSDDGSPRASMQQTLSSECCAAENSSAGFSGVIKRIHTFTFRRQSRRKHSKEMVDGNLNDSISERSDGKKTTLWVNLLMKFKKCESNESDEVADANPSATCICTGYTKKTDGEQVLVNPVADSGNLAPCPSPETNVNTADSTSSSAVYNCRSTSQNSDSEIGNGLQLTSYPSLNAFKSSHQVQERLLNEDTSTNVHSQVDYVHRLVPDLWQISCCSFYWGVMDRYEAEKVLENKPEGTFLLRDSAQEDFLFSVSFRRYGRSLHARIEHSNHEFSFDCTDRESFSSATICGLLEHYKDPSACMFFEPTLCIPLSRPVPFSLQHLARAKLCSMVTYDQVAALPLPRSLKSYLKVYHYKQKVRVRKLDDTGFGNDSAAATTGICGCGNPISASFDAAENAQSSTSGSTISGSFPNARSCVACIFDTVE